MSLSQLTTSIGHVRSDTTLREAARIMIRDSIGSLLICKENAGGVEGILTDRDIVREIASGRDPDRTSVGVFIGPPVKTLPQGATRQEITGAMRMHGIRRIPLVDEGGQVTAVASLDDLLVEMGTEIFDLARAIKVGFDHESSGPDASE